ncbi:putative alcohol dehydrogenase [Mollisia scopiformis]|uniref:Putative alcohol dehydrogenase n=1 Tax=Mollisia scopiformis TaxID=149040 RepID=A0A194WU77_MOLSC|nr:putative alcohol dehydrogenase [Mollisia scopiformis]KUJ11229.1 putative alcohol dehydrogenase [Mollisia scopiformis]
MLSLCTPSFGPPSKWQFLPLPTPNLTRDDEVLIKVHAAAINPTDIGGAQGRYWPAFNVPLPFKIGYDLAGTISAVGASVTKFKIGDEVFCCLAFKTAGFGNGSISEYAKSTEDLVVLKPRNLTFVQAASLPLVCLTAVQMFERIPGGVEGKAVWVTAGLSGVGSVAVQMAKNVYGAQRVCTSVSTRKVGLVDGLVGEGVVDEVVDYTKTDLKKAVPLKSVDVLIDTIGSMFSTLPLVKPGGMIITCAGPSPPSGRNLKNISSAINRFIEKLLDLIDNLTRWWVGRSGVNYDSVLMKANGSELERVRTWVEEHKIRPVVGKVLKFRDLVGIREECGRVMKGKGGVGKVVVEVIAE